MALLKVFYDWLEAGLHGALLNLLQMPALRYRGQVTSGAASVLQKAGAKRSWGRPWARIKRSISRKTRYRDFHAKEIPGSRPICPTSISIFPDITAFFGKSDGRITINNADDFCDYVMANAYGLVSVLLLVIQIVSLELCRFRKSNFRQ